MKCILTITQIYNLSRVW